MLDCVSKFCAENTESLVLVVVVEDVVQLCCVSINAYNGEVIVVLKKIVPHLPCVKAKMVMT